MKSFLAWLDFWSRRSPYDVKLLNIPLLMQSRWRKCLTLTVIKLFFPASRAFTTLGAFPASSRKWTKRFKNELLFTKNIIIPTDSQQSKDTSFILKSDLYCSAYNSNQVTFCQSIFENDIVLSLLHLFQNRINSSQQRLSQYFGDFFLIAPQCTYWTK